jgi:ribosomal protein L15
VTEEKRRNAEYARRRREAEAADKIRIAEINAIKKVLPNNPYTKQPIETNEDVEEYLVMRGIDEAGGDPVNDYFAKVRESRAAKQKTTDTNAVLQNQLNEFEDKYPDVNIKSLLNDEDFREYADGKLNNKSLAEVYASYTKFKSKLSSNAENSAVKKAVQEIANSAAAVGSLNNSTPPAESEFFTRDQVKAMKPEEIKKNYEKIMKSIKKW